jgi:DNA-binding transcriptional LysR family regulator
MDTLTSINVFRQVVESGSFVRAAERLELSTAAVSKHVMSVEKRLGVRLINRNSRSLSLTEPGKVYFERCKGILENLEKTELELESMSSAPQGTLRIACCDCCIPARWFGTLVEEYRRRWPDVVLDISFDDRAVNLIEDGYDLAFRLARNESSLPPALVARRVRPIRFVLAASHDYIKRNGIPKLPEDLARHNLVTTGSLEPLQLEGAEGRDEMPQRVVLRCRAMADVAMAVAAGMGLGALPAVVFEDPVFTKVLTPVLTGFRIKDSTLYLLYASRRFLPFKVRAFIDLILEAGSTSLASMPAAHAIDAPSAVSPLPYAAAN